MCVTELLGVPEPLREGECEPEPQPVVVAEEEAQREKVAVPQVVGDCESEGVKLPEKEAEPVREGDAVPVEVSEGLREPVVQGDTVPEALTLDVARERLALDVAHTLGEPLGDAVPQVVTEEQALALPLRVPEFVKEALPHALGVGVALAERHRVAVPLPEREVVPLREGVTVLLPERDTEGELLAQALTEALKGALPE